MWSLLVWAVAVLLCIKSVTVEGEPAWWLVLGRNPGNGHGSIPAGSSAKLQGRKPLLKRLCVVPARSDGFIFCGEWKNDQSKCVQALFSLSWKWGKRLLCSLNKTAPLRSEQCQLTVTEALVQRVDSSLYPPNNKLDKYLCHLGTLNSQGSFTWINHYLFSDYPELMIPHLFDKHFFFCRLWLVAP